MKNTQQKVRVEAHGVKGMENKKWRRVFKSVKTMNTWVEKNDAEVFATREVQE